MGVGVGMLRGGGTPQSTHSPPYLPPTHSCTSLHPPPTHLPPPHTHSLPHSLGLHSPPPNVVGAWADIGTISVKVPSIFSGRYWFQIQDFQDFVRRIFIVGRWLSFRSFQKQWKLKVFIFIQIMYFGIVPGIFSLF